MRVHLSWASKRDSNDVFIWTLSCTNVDYAIVSCSGWMQEGGKVADIFRCDEESEDPFRLG